LHTLLLKVPRYSLALVHPVDAQDQLTDQWHYVDASSDASISYTQPDTSDAYGVVVCRDNPSHAGNKLGKVGACVPTELYRQETSGQ